MQADDLRRVFGGSRGADAPMGLGGTGTPKRSWPKQARRKRIILTSRHFLSPLDTGPSRPLPEGLRPAAEVHGPPPTRGGCLRRHAALAHRGGGAGGRHRGRVQPHGGAHLGPTPHEKAQSAAPTSHRMRFSVTSPPGRRGARPPASLRGTMENDPTGQTRSDNPPPGCGGGCAGARRPQPGAWPHGKAQSGQRASLMARPASGRRRPRRRRRGAWAGPGAGPQAPPIQHPPPGPRERPQAANPRARGPRRPGRGRRGRW